VSLFTKCDATGEERMTSRDRGGGDMSVELPSRAGSILLISSLSN